MHSIGLIEEKLLNMTAENAEVMKRSSDQCTVKMLDKLTLSKLSDFIWTHDLNVLMKKDIPSNKEQLEDAKHAVEHSSTEDKNPLFTAYMCRDNPNKLTSLQLTSPTNEILTINDVGPTFVSLSGTLVHNQGDMPSSLFYDEEWESVSAVRCGILDSSSDCYT